MVSRMTREEAVAELRQRGFNAEARDWAMGETIQVVQRANEPDPTPGIVRLKTILWLLQDGDQWTLVEFFVQEPVHSAPMSFEDCVKEIRVRFDASDRE